MNLEVKKLKEQSRLDRSCYRERRHVVGKREHEKSEAIKN
ncbi:hypothetical protein LrDSM24759_09140 [Lactobacillus rodentium]|uniref:Uncharacterized protein n=1 Tax=Lactobacillus rodentium TaxID=947835 RepID=A0A2Z6TFG0_9LACO|nr:hypothetical protein LrDSM24759_09140 [Lactobacillus rodentium]